MESDKFSLRIPKSQFKITGYGMYLPPLVETAEELASKINKTPQWIISRAGVKERRVSQIDVDKMGALAIKEAVGGKNKPDLIINASGVPKQVIPDTSVFMQKELGYSGIPSFSVHATCLSFIVALNTAETFITTGTYSKILIITADRGTRGRNFNEPESAALLGDAAAAIVIEKANKSDQSELIEVNKCLNTMGNMSIVMGILGTLIGLILILQNFHNIGENLGPSLAVAIITLYYGFLFKALFMSASSKVEKYIK